MRLNFSTSWIFRGWITCFLVTFYAQHVVSKSVQCDEKHYLKGQKCCKRCEPGFYVHAHCNESQQTKCIKCNFGEYQPEWTGKTECLRQKFCDEGKGFMKSVENPLAEEPCRCRADLQCHLINCEFCEKIPTCDAGYGLEAEPESTNGRKICVACKKGFFSAGTNGECKQWTSCKAEGRSETQPGSAQADAVCGPPVSVAAPSWVIVSILSVITVLCLLILLLFCYKEKLILLSVNLRACVQNLKRTRIQQETLAPLYQSGGPKCTPCETTKLIYQASHNSTDEPSTFPTSDVDVKVSLPFTREMTEKEETSIKALTEEPNKGSGEPEEVSEEEEVVSVSPLLSGSCVCVLPVCEPLEVGENEDCSQAVSPGISGTCSCGGLDGDRDGDESVKADSGGDSLTKSETGAASLVSVSPPLLQMSSMPHPLSPLPELCPPLSQVQAAQEFKAPLTERSQLKEQDLHRLTSRDSTSTECSTTCVMSSVSPLMTSSSSVGELYLDKPPETSGQGPFWEGISGNKLSSGESELECSPESLHSQLTEPNLISGQVLGKHNTTFISSGQVMNFSGDVVVVYVSQTSLGSDGAGQDDAFGSPVQEEASETAQSFQNSPRSQGDSVCHATLQDETLPVQEMMEEQRVGK